MAKSRKTARVAASLLGVGAIAAAAVLPGSIATAESTGDVTTDVTRAVLIQGDANAELGRMTLITQINVEGNGTSQFTVPVADGGTPKNMDSFGGPQIEDGQAQYDLTVNGSQSIRTSQNYNGDVPVTVAVSATLDGQTVKPTDLAGKSGLAKLTYTFENVSGEPTQLTYKDALGNTVTEEVEVPVPLAGQLTMQFPDSWGNVTAPKATTVSGDGQGNTLVSATVPLLPKTLKQSTTGSVEIEARLDNAVVPPADIKFAVIPPDTTPDLQAGRKTAEDGSKLAAKLTDAGSQLTDGAGKLSDGLATAVDGATKIADGIATDLGPGIAKLSAAVSGELGPGVAKLSAGVADELGPGVQQLADGLVQFDEEGIGTLRSKTENLVESVTSDPGFAKLTKGFDAVDTALKGVRDGLGVYKDKSSQKPGPWIKGNGDVDTDRADVARTLWSLVYGARTQDIPTDSKNPNNVPNTNNGGLTNPDCNLDDPKSATNPCGAWQVIEVVIQNMKALAGDEGLKKIYKKLTSTSAADGGGAFAVNYLADALGCKVINPGDPGAINGVTPQTGPIVPQTKAKSIAEVLANASCSKPITVGGNALCDAKSLGLDNLPAIPCNVALSLVLGGADVNISGPGGLVKNQAGLTQAIYAPLYLDKGNPPKPQDSSGLAAVLGVYYTGAFKLLEDGLVELQGNITTDKTGQPDADTTKKVTATGIVMQTRASLALGGVGKSLYPAGRCTGFKTAGDPSSGVNDKADEDSVKDTCSAGDVVQVALYGVEEIEKGVSTTLLEGIRDTTLKGIGVYKKGCDPGETLACASGTLAAGGELINEGVNEGAGGNPSLVDALALIDEGVNKGSGGNPSLVDALALVDEGVNKGSGGNPSLVSGTRQLADGLPAAVDGANKIKTDAGQALEKSGNDASKEAGVAIATLDALQARYNGGAGIPGGAPVGATSYGGVYAFALDGAGGTATENAARGALALLALIGAGAVGAVLGKRAVG